MVKSAKSTGRRSPPAGGREGAKIPEEVGATELGRLFGVTRRQIVNLTTDGVLLRTGHGKYPVAENVQRRIKFLVEAATEKAAPKEDPLEAEKVRRARRENDVAERNLIPIAEAEDALAAIVGPLMTELASLPVNFTMNLQLRADLEDALTTVVNGLAERNGKVGETLREGGDPFKDLAEGDADGVGEEPEIPADNRKARGKKA